VVALISPFISHAIGFNMYLIYSVSYFAMATFVVLKVPETKGMTLEGMDSIRNSTVFKC
jgi:Sugar (and other) transporter